MLLSANLTNLTTSGVLNDKFTSQTGFLESIEFSFENILLLTFLIILILLTVLGNIIVILAIIFDLHLRSPTHFLLGSLAIADLLLGILR